MPADEPLPTFRYHPDPIATESIEESSDRCSACGRTRGFIFSGAVYSRESDLQICPWCISDGTASERFGASFSDTEPWVPDEIDREVVEAIEHRTPGFTAWQAAHWLFHCGDGAAFVGRVGGEEVRSHPEALAMIRAECADNGWDEQQTEQYLDAMAQDGDVTGYRFRCLHCGSHLAYSDFS